ncbi:MAG: hypothetical protein IPF58_18130 [Saprospirales bacterium]|nr:hypothetical protein [Saprospirales bacterium]
MKTEISAFIEPNETVFLNNELVELYLDERKEIRKILIDLTSRIQPQKRKYRCYKR